MSDTPRCDQHVSNWRNLAPGEVSTMEFARQLERELNAAKAENAAMREVINGVSKILRSIELNDIFEETMRNHAVIALSKLQPYLK